MVTTGGARAVEATPARVGKHSGLAPGGVLRGAELRERPLPQHPREGLERGRRAAAARVYDKRGRAGADR
eukprot:4234104-Pyramimonas_sp.AAC.1